MATTYYRGQGRIWIASRTATGLTSAFTEIGDAEALQVSFNENFDDVYESQSGMRRKVVHTSTQTDVQVKITSLNFDGASFKRMLLGTAGSSASATITDEKHYAEPGKAIFLSRPATSIASITQGGTAVASSNYTLEAATGKVTFTGGITAGEVLVDYTTAEVASVTETLTNGTDREYVIVFQGKNMNLSGAPVIVRMHRATINLPATMDLIGTSTGKFEFSAYLLQDDTIADDGSKSQYMTIVNAKEA